MARPKGPKTIATAFRFTEPMLELIDGFVNRLGLNRTRMVEESVVAAVEVYNASTAAVRSALGELAERYGADAPITIRLGEDDDGNTQAIVLIDGMEAEDVTVALSVSEETGHAHVFLDVDDWYPDRLCTVRFGDVVVITRPLRAVCTLPWPVDETLGLVARLGELAEGPAAGRLIRFDTVAVGDA